MKTREDPIVTKLDNDLFKSLFTNELNDLVDMFKKYNYEIRIAGGAVRDLLMNKKPVDLDFATTATPTEMKTMFETENIRMINMNGEKHGTITPRINDKENFECTTLRIDVVTDGRHAEVEFTQDWLLDANRRDLTINAMFLGFDGSVYDYFYGFEDLQQRRVRFVGNADRRIKEDFLRILRYFRFYGRIAASPNKHDPETLKTIAANAEGLKRISGERIWVELKKILESKYAGDLMEVMVECGLLQNIGKPMRVTSIVNFSFVFLGFPEKPNVDDFETLWKNRRSEDEIHPITLLSSLLYTFDDAIHLHERLKLSAYERDLMYFITQRKSESKNVDVLMPFQQMCLQPLGKPRDTKDYVEELLKFQGKWNLHDKLRDWVVPRFPIDGSTLKEHNCPSGKLMGVVINRLREIWVQNEFKSTPEELLAQLPKVLEDLNIVDGKQVKKSKTR